MRIEVSGSPAVQVERLRTYVEYRVFSHLGLFADEVDTVRVVLTQSREDAPTSCLISVELRHGDPIRAESRGSQPVRAIDSAAAQLVEATRERLGGR